MTYVTGHLIPGENRASVIIAEFVMSVTEHQIVVEQVVLQELGFTMH